jgi:hypothetical protein
LIEIESAQPKFSLSKALKQQICLSLKDVSIMIQAFLQSGAYRTDLMNGTFARKPLDWIDYQARRPLLRTPAQPGRGGGAGTDRIRI